MENINRLFDAFREPHKRTGEETDLTGHSVRVCHLLKTTGIAGAEAHLLTLLPAMREKGVESRIILMQDPRRPALRFVDRMRTEGIPVNTISIRWHWDPAIPGLLNRMLSGLPFDILHAHLPHGEVYGAQAMSSFPGRRFVISRHNDDRFRRWLPFRVVFAPSLRRADAVIAISSAVQRFLLAVEKVPEEKITCIRYGMDAEAFARQVKPESVAAAFGGKTGSRIGFIGRLTRQKGVDVLLRAFAGIERSLPDARLIIVGDGPDRRALERLAAALRLQHCLFLGWREDTPTVMAGLDFVVIPSRWEGFGLVALEAMALAKPIVATNVSALPEIVLQEETGLLVAPEDPASLESALRRLLAEDGLASRLGLAGQERLSKYFTVREMAEKTALLYHGLFYNSRNSS